MNQTTLLEIIFFIIPEWGESAIDKKSHNTPAKKSVWTEELIVSVDDDIFTFSGSWILDLLKGVQTTKKPTKCFQPLKNITVTSSWQCQNVQTK